MKYRTQPAEDLVDSYQRQAAMNRAKAEKAEDRFARGVYTGYADAFDLAAEWAIAHLGEVEEAARVVPVEEEDFLSYADKVAAEAWSEAELRYAHGDR